MVDVSDDSVIQNKWRVSLPPQVTALAAGRLEEAAERDTLLVGSQTTLLAYDVDNNADIYYKVTTHDLDRPTLGSVTLKAYGY